MTNPPDREPEGVARASLKKAAEEVDRAIARLRQGLDDGSLPSNKTRKIIAHWEKVAAQMRSEDDGAADRDRGWLAQFSNFCRRRGLWMRVPGRLYPELTASDPVAPHARPYLVLEPLHEPTTCRPQAPADRVEPDGFELAPDSHRHSRSAVSAPTLLRPCVTRARHAGLPGI